ncbi:hypothetical protein HPE56_11360 [Maribacter sp. ANRC-HE7]|uniref:Lipoprotein n=1 Tax=Maribacter aquimaris TaxID=2737171 RepID=A0ABR7V0M9_9FLAO|nr:hypothetical protein [Maribacter aquimaris]MBD0778392.1 hypothetical protein [Maribacter aquimaris]
MKRIIIISIALLMGLIGCQETKKEQPGTTEKISETNHQADSKMSQEPDNAWISEIVLDNGVKWKANKETTDGVVLMLSYINERQPTTSNEYRALGDRLNTVKNTVVKECTMDGASHDNLHIWLHPLIKKIAMLQKTQNQEEGALLLLNLKTHLEGYYDYFN